MSKAAFRVSLLTSLLLLTLTPFLQTARADAVSLGSGTLSGNTILYVNVLGNPQVCVFGGPVCPAASWTIQSTLGGVWTEKTSAVLAPVFEDFGPYMSMAFTSGTLDFNGTGTQYQAVLALSGTVKQFVATLNALPFGQTIQLPLFSGPGCIAETCTGETISHVLFNDLVGQQNYPLAGAGFLTITNDPGLYEVTVTSKPLNTSVPEPSSLILLGTGVLGIWSVRAKRSPRRAARR